MKTPDKLLEIAAFFFTKQMVYGTAGWEVYPERGEVLVWWLTGEKVFKLDVDGILDDLLIQLTEYKEQDGEK